MKKATNIILFFIAPALLCAQVKQQAGHQTIPITWVDSLRGDYSFISKWSYNENVFTNNFGQLICDVDCPRELDGMRDSTGRIYDSLIHDYYKLLDTTHYFHTLECEAWCYEFGEADYVTVVRKGDRVNVSSEINAATHSSLRLNIENDVCTPTIKLISIITKMTPAGPKDVFYYHCTGGYIKIDKTVWQQDIMKAEFYFTFYHPEKPKQKMYWKGKIYAKIAGPGK